MSEKEMIIDLMDKIQIKKLLVRVYRLLEYLYLYKDGGAKM